MLYLKFPQRTFEVDNISVDMSTAAVTGAVVIEPSPYASLRLRAVALAIAAHRKRIGPGGAEKIFSSSISLHGEKALEKEVVVDTTNQEKDITFPTDTKLAAKIVKAGVKLARRNNLALRQSYVRTLPKLLLAQRGRRSKNGALRAKKVTRKLKTIAWRVVNQLDHSLPPESDDRRRLSIPTRVLSQKRKDSKNIYSLHEPHVYCLSKGKEHKRYEFGAKASVLVGKQGDSINLLLAATAANLSLWMRKILSALVQILFQIPLHIPIPNSPALQRAF
jgi:hypothetical protein